MSYMIALKIYALRCRSRNLVTRVKILWGNDQHIQIDLIYSDIYKEVIRKLMYNIWEEKKKNIYGYVRGMIICKDMNKLKKIHNNKKASYSCKIMIYFYTWYFSIVIGFSKDTILIANFR